MRRSSSSSSRTDQVTYRALGSRRSQKLLRSTNVKKIYVLIRPKKGLEIKYRLQELMSSKLFENLKQTKPGVMSRVEAIPGDITKPGFAISEDDQRYKDKDKRIKVSV